MTLSLPIDARISELLTSLERTPSLVLVAEPGAGKTTRLPPALLQAEFARGSQILVLEPRRIAARMAAARVAEELGEAVGERVGFSVRFERAAGPRTRLFFLTEALLTRRLLEDPQLRGVSCVVLDEFHERSLHTDLALLMLKRLQETARPDLRIVVMSATLDADRVAGFLKAPVVSVEGRAFPVEIEHAALVDSEKLERQVATAVRKLLVRKVSGDILVFLPGALEIRRAAEACEPLASTFDIEIAALHGDLPAHEQARVVRQGARRKVVLSTNVAETSVTLEGVVAVVDTGLARMAGHSPWSGLPTLNTQKISQASAVQRAGRAGRTRPGTCVRLYTAADFQGRARFDLPELARSDLAATELCLRVLLGRAPRDADFFEPPPGPARASALGLLRRLSALDSADQVTELGRRLLDLPLHPRVGRLFLALVEAGHGERGAVLAALLSERDPRRSSRTSFRAGAPAQNDEVADSDLLARLDAFEALGGDHRAETVRRFDLDPGVVRGVARLSSQLLRSAKAGLRIPSEDFELSARKATLLAFSDRVARRRGPRSAEVVLAAGGAATLSPASVVKEAELMVLLEADERRGQRSVRAASAIEPEWLLEWFPERVRSETRVTFDPESERVSSREALLYDELVLDESQKAACAGPEAARMLAEAALARGNKAPWDTDAVEQWQRRLRFAAQRDSAIKPLTDAALFDALMAYAEGKSSFAELSSPPFEQVLPMLLDPEGSVRVERLAPATIALPSGRRLKVRYELDRPPWVASRLQDFFGMLDGPRLLDGTVPLVLHLLAPNQRPVQVTTDLKGFWERHYPGLRRELMRRYPRHAWPEDPKTAEPPAPRAARHRRSTS